jgi:hypothetical protein
MVRRITMGRGRGRPNKEIDQEQFEKLCEIQCTQEEICEFLDVTDKTLARWCKRTYGMGFCDVFRVKRKSGMISLRRAQYQVAKDGNPTMLIWLGKQWLGQSEKPSSADIAEAEISDEIEALLAELDDDV